MLINQHDVKQCNQWQWFIEVVHAHQSLAMVQYQPQLARLLSIVNPKLTMNKHQSCQAAPQPLTRSFIAMLVTVLVDLNHDNHHLS